MKNTLINKYKIGGIFVDRVKINGTNSHNKECLDCGKELTRKEYDYGRKRCLKCRSAYYGRQNKKYIGFDGSNNIDEILIAKIGRS